MYRLLCSVLLVVSCGAVALGIFAFSGDLPRQLLVSCIFVTMWVAMAYGMYEAFFLTIRASDRGLELDRPLCSTRHLPWVEIQKVTYTSLGNWYRFRSVQGWSVRISIYRDGLSSFAGLVTKHIGQSPARFTPIKFYEHTAA